MGRRRWAATRLGPTAVARTVLTARTLRGFADGFVSVVLARHLIDLGLSPFQIGAIVTATLLGSAALTLAFGLNAHRTSFLTLLVGAAVIMIGTGVGFATFTSFVPLLLVGLLGTLNPSAGDVSAFLPTEQALLSTQGEPEDRPRLYARYNVGGTLAGALGALVSSGPEALAHRFGWEVTATLRLTFLVYAAIGVVILVLYRRLPRPRPGATGTATATTDGPARSALGPHRRTVLGLAALFSLDSAGGGFVVTSLLVLWLRLRFDLSAGVTGAVFFATGVLAGCSQLLAPRLARRIG
ncbi:MAG: major facilitator superfamily protein, partial [Acidimicrobiales bacterium]|nr:major facilitator superfamily protein [Acidimicrobiales bacterium]